MRSNSFLLIGAACLLLFLLQSSAHAQHIVLSSSTSYNPTSQKVIGVSQMTMDYETTYFYRCKTKGYISTLRIPAVRSQRLRQLEITDNPS